MSSSTGSVEEKIRMLPPDLREEAIHFIDELAKRKKNSGEKRSSAWAGPVAFPTSIKV